MKKILFFCAIFFTALTSNAQSVQVLRNGKTIAEFYERDGWTFVYGNNTNVLNGHEFVTIGGKKWATMNVGATTVAGSYATCTGDFYQWGSLHTLYSSKTWNGSTWNFATWKSGIEGGYVDENKEYTTDADLPAANDVARKEWGELWRMPTVEDFKALAKACTGSDESDQSPIELNTSTPSGGIYWLAANQEYLSDYKGVAGLLFVDQTDTNKRVFFPAAGRVVGTSFNFGGSGLYWSSSLNSSYTSCAYRLYFNASYVSPFSSDIRYYGFSVRPVSD